MKLVTDLGRDPPRLRDITKTAVIDRAADIVASAADVARVIADRNQERRVTGKAQATAERLQKLKTDLDADMDEINADMDVVDKLRPVAKSASKSFVAAKKEETEGLIKVLTQLTNLPLDTGESSDDSNR